MFNVVVYKYSFPNREGLILQIEDQNGYFGYGEVAPLPGFSKESLDQALDQLREVITRDDETPMPMYPSVAFGVESAYLTLMANKNHSAVNQVILPQAPSSIPVNVMLKGESQDVLDGIRKGLDEGFKVFKIKLGDAAPIMDIRLLEAVSNLLPTDCSMRVDLNRKWSLETALEYASVLKSLPIDYVEEPLADVRDLVELYDETELSIAIDETLQDAPDLPLLGLPYISTVIIKPTLIGGTHRCLEIAQDALATDKTVVFTSSYESSLGCYIIASMASTISPKTAHGVMASSGELFSSPLVVNEGEMSLNHSLKDLLLDSCEVVIS